MTVNQNRKEPRLFTPEECDEIRRRGIELMREKDRELTTEEFLALLISVEEETNDRQSES